MGQLDAPDEQIMRYAADNGWVILTNDLDFGDILAVTHGQKPSVIQVRARNVSPQAIGDLVLSGIAQMFAELEAGVLMTIDATQTRIRLLPLVFRH